MFDNISLVVTAVAYIFSFFITTLFGIWVYLKSSRKTSHVMFLLMTLMLGIYQIAHVFGITTVDSSASRDILQLTLALLFAVAFMVHWIAAVVEREREYRPWIIATYVFAGLLFVFYMAFPSAYLLESAPKLYFPNYYVAGGLFWLFLAYFGFCFAASMRMLLRAYAMADALHRNRLAYYIIAICIGLPVGSIGFFLSYGIPIDPIYSVPFTLFVAPLAYGTLRYDIMDIKLAARKALSYAIFVAGTALFIIASNEGDKILSAAYPYFPEWSVPLASSLVIVLFAGYLWERMRDLDVLKYEFITVVTHKFRTPLTRIKWASEIIKHHIPENAPADDDQKLALSEIDDAGEHLVVLTDMLISLRKANDMAYQYEFETSDVRQVVEKAVRNVLRRAKDKGVTVSTSEPKEPVFASMDSKRMLFALQIVIDNAVAYTPENGQAAIAVSSDGTDITVKVTDSGIGISREDLSRIFNKFWRSKEAKAVDTEGMGIGLFMARQIVERHGGDITVDSPGLGKGSTFAIRLPVARE